MGTADPRIDRYLAIDRPWRDELAALRDILLAEDLTETLKWRAPCYTANGGNVAMLGNLKGSAFVSFFKGVLIDDPEGLLVPPGPNSRSARYMLFADLGGVTDGAHALRTALRQAIANEREARKVDMPADDLALPDALEEALVADPELGTAFDALTPGRRRGYIVQISGAKQLATRRARVAKWRGRILDGKGIHDR